MNKQGFVIALDGSDGVGKTTQLNLLRDFLKAKGKAVHTTRASGGTPMGEMLRNVSLSDLSRPTETDAYISLAMFAALAHDLKLRKDRGEVIIVDRSPLAMVAYNAYGGQLPQDSKNNLTPTKNWILEACADTFRAWGVDVLIFLDAPQSALDARRRKRQTQDYFENQDADYHDRVRQGYQAGLQYLEALSDFPTHIHKTDASPGIEAISQSIINTIEKQFSA